MQVGRAWDVPCAPPIDRTQAVYHYSLRHKVRLNTINLPSWQSFGKSQASSSVKQSSGAHRNEEGDERCEHHFGSSHRCPRLSEAQLPIDCWFTDRVSLAAGKARRQRQGTRNLTRGNAKAQQRRSAVARSAKQHFGTVLNGLQCASAESRWARTSKSSCIITASGGTLEEKIDIITISRG